MTNMSWQAHVDDDQVCKDVQAKGAVTVGCQTEPNLIDKLIDSHVRRPRDDDQCDLYQDYVRSVQCDSFWPLDKNPIRALVPAMINVDLPEQHLKNESLMFDLVQAVTDNSKLVNLLAKYIHHIVPNVIISKRIDLIPLITCTIRVCRDQAEQERLISLLFNLIKRPNEEQRRMILSGLIVVFQISPGQSLGVAAGGSSGSPQLLPNLWDHVQDKFPERRILLAEVCASLAHYVRPAIRTNLMLAIVVRLLKDKNAAVRSASCKSFACLLTLIMDRRDELFDSCMAATEELIQDVMEQTPVSYCEHRYELEQMRFCALETVFPLMCMWSVKLNRFKDTLALAYMNKTLRYLAQLLSSGPPARELGVPAVPTETSFISGVASVTPLAVAAAAAEAIARRRSVFLETRDSYRRQSEANYATPTSTSSASSGADCATSASGSHLLSALTNGQLAANCSLITSQRALASHLKMLNYMVPFVFSDAVHSCAWLSKSADIIASPTSGSASGSPDAAASPSCGSSRSNSSASSRATLGDTTTTTANKNHHQQQDANNNNVQSSPASTTCNLSRSSYASHLDSISFEQPEIKFHNKLLSPSLLIDEPSILAFRMQLEENSNGLMDTTLEWLADQFLPKFLTILSYFSHKSFYQLTSNDHHQSHHQSHHNHNNNHNHNHHHHHQSHNNSQTSTGSSPGATNSSGNNNVIQDLLTMAISSIRQLCLLFGKRLTRDKIRPMIKQCIATNGHKVPCLYSVLIASLTAFEPIEQCELEEITLSIENNLNLPDLARSEVEILAISIKIIATNPDQIHSPSIREKLLSYVIDALVRYSIKILNKSQSQGGQSSAASSKAAASACCKRKEFTLIMFRHMLTCLVDPSLRPSGWSQIIVSKFLPSLITLANDSADVYVCTYARLMCAQLVETFDTYLSSSKLDRQTAEQMAPALQSLQNLTEQIKSSNLKRQIEAIWMTLANRFNFRDSPHVVNSTQFTSTETSNSMDNTMDTDTSTAEAPNQPTPGQTHGLQTPVPLPA